MKRVFFIFIICIFIVPIFAQRQKSNNSRILVNSSKPAVFITFLRLKEIKPDDPTDDKDNVFFQITNNTRWNILIQMSGVSKKDYGDASLYYAVEDKKDGTIRSGSTSCHVCSVNPLGSGRSIIFSVPLREASNDTLMRIAYSFDWERDNESKDGSYSTHSVEYYFDNLPKSIPLSQTSFNK